MATRKRSRKSAVEETAVEGAASVEETAPEAVEETPSEAAPKQRRRRAVKPAAVGNFLKLHLTIQGKEFVLTFDEAQELHGLLTNALPA